MHGLTWQPPKARQVRKIPFIPTEAEIDALTSGCSVQMATFLQLLKETGARSGEAYRVRWTDIDTVNNTVRITPLKGSNPRIFKMSSKLVAMLNRLPKTSEKVFTYRDTYNLRKTFSRQRKRTAKKWAPLDYYKYTFIRCGTGRRRWNMLEQETYCT